MYIIFMQSHRKFRLILLNTKKIAVTTEVETAILVGVTGVEPAASTSQMWRATSCATPRSMLFFVSFDSIYYFVLFVNN